PHRAAALFGDPPGLREQRRLAQACLAPEHQQAAGGRTVRAQGVDRLRERGDFLVPLPQGRRGGGRAPYLRHPAPSPSRPNDVLSSSVAARSPSRWRDRARVAVTGDSGYGGRRIGPATSGSHGQQLSRGRKVTIRQILVRGPRGVAPPRPGEGSSRGGRPRSGAFHGVGRAVRRGPLEGARIGAAPGAGRWAGGAVVGWVTRYVCYRRLGVRR